jgi:hypothetical protein
VFLLAPLVNAIEGIGNLGVLWTEGGIGDIHGLFPGDASTVVVRTGTGAGYSLNSVTLEHIFDLPLEQPHLQVRIYKYNHPFPVLPPPDDTLIAALGNPAIDPTHTQWPGETLYVNYFPDSPVILEPNSIYWVVVSMPIDQDDMVSLLYTFSRDHTGLCDWDYFGVGGWTSVNGAEWLKFKVDVDPIDGQLPVCNQPPDCSEALPSVSQIWPPSGQMVNVNILGVTDSDGDPVQITITGITQDEPVVSSSNKTKPDGNGIGTATASLRAEREASGNGRVYQVSFDATDGRGGVCHGQVRVCVPVDVGRNLAIDGGQLYDSTGP